MLDLFKKLKQRALRSSMLPVIMALMLNTGTAHSATIADATIVNLQNPLQTQALVNINLEVIIGFLDAWRTTRYVWSNGITTVTGCVNNADFINPGPSGLQQISFNAPALPGDYTLALIPYQGGGFFECFFGPGPAFILPIRAANYDYGDAPADYGVTGENGGQHAIIPGKPYLGSIPPDDENNGQPSDNADEDDLAGIADEDGIDFVPAYAGEDRYYLSVQVNNPSDDWAQLVGYIDWSPIYSAAGDNKFDEVIDQSMPGLESISGNPACDNTDIDVSDNTFTTGNIPPGCVGVAVLQWDLSSQGLPIINTADFQLFSRLRITSDTESGFYTDSSPAPNRPVGDGEIEDHSLILSITPVTLSHVSSSLQDGKLRVDWGTSSELFNVGFQLWGQDQADDRWHPLHNWLIKSGSGNAVEPQSYTKTVNIPGSISTLKAIGLSSVDSDGSEHYYGPFIVGRSYGELSNLEPIAWSDIRAENDARMAANGYVRNRVNGYTPVARAIDPESTGAVVQFNISISGVFRLTASELLSSGIDWRQVRKGDIALLNHLGEPQVLYVQAKGDGAGQNQALGEAGEIYFYAQPPSGVESLYTKAATYRLVQDRYRARVAGVQRQQGPVSNISSRYRELSRVEEDNQYALNSQVDDPWIDRTILSSGSPRGFVKPLPIEADAISSQPAELVLNLGRSSALSRDRHVGGSDDGEHFVLGAVVNRNGEAVWLETLSEVGSGSWTARFLIPAGTELGDSTGMVRAGGIFSAGPGYAFSEIQLDSMSLEYSRPYKAREGEDFLHFSAPLEGESGYRVRVPDTGWPMIFAHDGSNLVRILPERTERLKAADGSLQRLVDFNLLQGVDALQGGSELKYWVSGKRGFLSVEGLQALELKSQSELLASVQGSNYLLVAHSAFMGKDTATGRDYLEEFAQLKQGQGYGVSVVNYMDVVSVFGGGQPGPHGLTRYLKALGAGSGIDYVLLVGGSTYDHTGNLDTGARTYIPAHYGSSHHSSFTATDTPYITSEQGDLFAAIGRWPVRQMSDLASIVDKSVAWSSRDRSSAEALMIAEAMIEGENMDFRSALKTLESALPQQWQKTRIYVDDILQSDPALTIAQANQQARTEIISQLNSSPDLVMYNGHASTRQLSNKGLLKSDHIAEVTAPGAELWLPMSCYITFYESTSVNTLAHQLLFSGNAVNIAGATLLSSQGENVSTGRGVLDLMLNQGLSLGTAANRKKSTSPGVSLRNNWSILGDPSNRF